MSAPPSYLNPSTPPSCLDKGRSSHTRSASSSAYANICTPPQDLPSVFNATSPCTSTNGSDATTAANGVTSGPPAQLNPTRHSRVVSRNSFGTFHSHAHLSQPYWLLDSSFRWTYCGVFPMLTVFLLWTYLSLRITPFSLLLYESNVVSTGFMRHYFFPLPSDTSTLLLSFHTLLYMSRYVSL